eukprot:GEMP01020846.1.p1 GENE.GEMP01020846.1~~GEMP01020846.1.p1  ORF type:complete len:577 (+),score=156.11 GEMP01020846.1:189-1919(+)
MWRTASAIRMVPFMHQDSQDVHHKRGSAPRVTRSPCSRAFTPLLPATHHHHRDHAPSTSSWNVLLAPFGRHTAVHCQEPDDGRYARQTSIQFSVMRENIIRRAVTDASFYKAYTVEAEIGVGAFGKVWRVRDKTTGQVRAAKEIKKSDLSKDQWQIFEVEVGFLTKLDHPNVVRLIEFFKDDDDVQDGSMFLILELCRGPDLFDRMTEVFSNPGGFTELEAGRLLRDMLKAVLCCHCNNICHRDIKPENFMFPTANPHGNDPIKMIDLGLSEKFVEGKALSGTIGTVGYMAPEVVLGKYSRECDIWSLGVIFFVLLTAHPLLPLDVPQKKVDQLTKDGKYVARQLRTHANRISPEARDLLVQMLQADPKDRVTAQQALQHPFILSIIDPIDDTEVSIGALGRRRQSSTKEEYKKVAVMLENYASLPMLKRASLLILAHVADLEEPSVRASQRVFRKFDADGNGELSTVEIDDAFRGEGVDLPSDWPDIIRRVDIDNSGAVNFVEWTAATLPPKVYMQDQYARAAFQFLDVRKVGQVSWEDIVVLFPSLKKQSIEEQQKVLVKAVGKPALTSTSLWK